MLLVFSFTNLFLNEDSAVASRSEWAIAVTFEASFC